MQTDKERVDALTTAAIEPLNAEIARLRAENQAKAAGLLVPGEWVCDTCGFRLHKMTLRASDGAVGVSTEDVRDICNNDGTALRPVTWREEAEEARRIAMQQMDACRAAEHRAEAAESRVTKLRQWMAEYPQDKYTGAWWLSEFDRICQEQASR